MVYCGACLDDGVSDKMKRGNKSDTVKVNKIQEKMREKLQEKMNQFKTVCVLFFLFIVLR